MGGYCVRTKGTYRKGSSFGSEKMEKKIIILGRIGNTVFQNNDSGKVLSGGGCYKVYQDYGS